MLIVHSQGPTIPSFVALGEAVILSQFVIILLACFFSPILLGKLDFSACLYVHV